MSQKARLLLLLLNRDHSEGGHRPRLNTLKKTLALLLLSGRVLWLGWVWSCVFADLDQDRLRRSKNRIPDKRIMKLPAEDLDEA